MPQTVTIFKSITATSAGFNRSVDFVFERIRTGKSKELLSLIRLEPEKEVRNKLKMGLPSICFSGTFSNRSAAGLVKHSGLICLDFDGFEDDATATAWRDTLTAWEYTFAIFTSPSGNGLKVLVRIPETDAVGHKEYFEALENHWEECQYFDRSTSDVCRVCYESYDPNLYVNTEADIWHDKATKELHDIGVNHALIPVKSDTIIISTIHQWWEKKKKGGGKGRNADLFVFASALNRFGVNKGAAEQHLSQFAVKDFPNSEILKEIAYTPSSTAKLKTVAVKIDELKKKNSKYNILDSNVSASDINGKFDANTKNSAGKAGIGVIANKLQVFNFLAKVGTQLTEGAFNYQIGGYTGTGYQYTNKKGERISDSLSTLLSVMTDNAKDPIAGQLNLSQELLSTYSELLAQGLPEYEASLLINLPIIQDYSNYKKVINYSLKSDFEEGITKGKTIKYTLAKFLNEDFADITDESLKAYKEEIKNISTQDMEDIISGKMTDPVLLKSIQINALMQLIEVEKISDITSNINTFLKLNQGLSTSFVELQQKLDKAFDELGLLSNGTDNPDVEVPVRVGKALNADKLTLDNIARATKVLERGKKMFISQTDTFKKAYAQLNDILHPSFANKKNTYKELSKNLLGYISTKGYINLLKKTINDPTIDQSIKDAYTKRLANIDNRLLYKGLDGETLGQQLKKLKSHPEESIRGNSLIKYLQESGEDEALDIVSSKSFVKESPETISILLDSYKDLYNNKETRDFAINMFNYLIVKDNLEFKPVDDSQKNK